MRKRNTLVIGGGINGLTTALALLRAGHQVTVWSEEPVGKCANTSSNAYSVWTPSRMDGDPPVDRWAFETLAEWQNLSTIDGIGVRLGTVIDLKMKQEEPWYANRMTCFRHARPGEITDDYTDAHVLEQAPIIDTAKYLPWLFGEV